MSKEELEYEKVELESTVEYLHECILRLQSAVGEIYNIAGEFEDVAKICNTVIDELPMPVVFDEALLKACADVAKLQQADCAGWVSYAAMKVVMVEVQRIYEESLT